jgi:hypothetical protein
MQNISTIVVVVPLFSITGSVVDPDPDTKLLAGFGSGSRSGKNHSGSEMNLK